MTTTSQLNFIPDAGCANQNPIPFPFSPQNNSYAPLQMSSLNPKRSFFKFPHKGDRSQRDDLMFELNELKQSIKQVEKQPNFDLQGLINGHSSTIEALNQRELMLQEREFSLSEKIKDYEAKIERFRTKVS